MGKALTSHEQRIGLILRYLFVLLSSFPIRKS